MALDLKRAGEAEDPRVVDHVRIAGPPVVEGSRVARVELGESAADVVKRSRRRVDDGAIVRHALFLSVAAADRETVYVPQRPTVTMYARLHDVEAAREIGALDPTVRPAVSGSVTRVEERVVLAEPPRPA